MPEKTVTAIDITGEWEKNLWSNLQRYLAHILSCRSMGALLFPHRPYACAEADFKPHGT